MYENSCELIYDMISKRIKFKKKQLQKHNSDIYPDDISVMSAIINNRRNPKKNKYLIPAKSRKKQDKADYISEISSNLEFASRQALLWGNITEIEAYSGRLFYCLLIDALECEREEIKDQIYKVLADYIPFALHKFYFDLQLENSDLVKFLIDTKYHINEDDFFYMRDRAIRRIYQRLSMFHLGIIGKFLNTLENTIRLDKAFSVFVKTKLLPAMQNALPVPSLGKEAEEIMYRNHKRLCELFNYELQLSPEAMGYHENDSDYYDRQIIYSLVKAGSQYVGNLADIQENVEEHISDTLLQNKWKPEMCI